MSTQPNDWTDVNDWHDVGSAPAAPAAPSQLNADYVYTNNGYRLNPMNKAAKPNGPITVFTKDGKIANLTLDPKLPAAMAPGVIEGNIKNSTAPQGVLDRIKSSALYQGFTGPNANTPQKDLSPGDSLIRGMDTVGRPISNALVGTAGAAGTALSAGMQAMQNPASLIQTLPPMAKGLLQIPAALQHAGITAPSNLIGGAADFARTGDPTRMQTGAGQVVSETLPAIYGAKQLGDAGLKAMANSEGGAYVQARAANSMIKPRAVDFKFGADPIAEAVKIKPAGTMGKYLENVKSSIGESETQLQQAIKDRNAAADSIGAPKGIDVGPSVRAAFDDMAKQATRDGNTGLASRLGEMADTRIAEMKSKYGGTYLTPEEILFEKRALAEEVKFKSSETAQMSVNEAKANMYRALDANFDTLVPEAKAINASYGSKIQLSKLVEKRLQEGMNAPMISKESLPETVFKSNLMKLLNYGKEGAASGTPVYEFHKPPNKNPYPTEGAGAVQLGANQPATSLNLSDEGPPITSGSVRLGAYQPTESLTPSKKNPAQLVTPNNVPKKAGGR